MREDDLIADSSVVSKTWDQRKGHKAREEPIFTMIINGKNRDYVVYLS